MYLTYNEYLSMGGTLNESDYTGYEYEAENIIDWYTFNRLHIGGRYPETYPEQVKRCVFYLVSIAQLKAATLNMTGLGADSSNGLGISSQSNDGVSVTYNTMSAAQLFDTVKGEAQRAVYMYLQGVKNELGHNLLYRGVYPDDE